MLSSAHSNAPSLQYLGERALPDQIVMLAGAVVKLANELVVGRGSVHERKDVQQV